MLFVEDGPGTGTVREYIISFDGKIQRLVSLQW